MNKHHQCAGIDAVSKELSKHNAGLTRSVFGGLFSIEVVKLDGTKRGAMPKVCSTFCPFCGVRLNEGPLK